MNIYWSYLEQKLVPNVYSKGNVGTFEFVLRDKVEVSLYIVEPQNVTIQPYKVVPLPYYYSVELVGKKPGDFKAEPLFCGMEWSTSGTGESTVYTCNIYLNNKNLIQAMEGSSSSEMNVEDLLVTAELTTVSGEGENVESTQFAVNVIPSVIRKYDVCPTPVEYSSSSSLSSLSTSSISSSSSSISSISSSSVSSSSVSSVSSSSLSSPSSLSSLSTSSSSSVSTSSSWSRSTKSSSTRSSSSVSSSSPSSASSVSSSSPSSVSSSSSNSSSSSSSKSSSSPSSISSLSSISSPTSQSSLSSSSPSSISSSSPSSSSPSSSSTESFARYVSKTGSDTYPYDTWAKAASSIQDAIDVYSKGTVWIENGTYSEKISIGANITVRSKTGSSADVTITGSGVAGVAVVGNSGWLIGCTITGGNNNWDWGGGVKGGKVYNCTITGNASAYGGGAAFSTLYNCVITSNTTTYLGGGASWCTLYNCLVSSNTVTYSAYGACGGGIFYCPSYNSTFVKNTAYEGGGVGWHSIIENCISYGNNVPDSFSPPGMTTGSETYSCGPGYTEVNSINSDVHNPNFVNFAGNNFRLASTSPCINVGHNYSWMNDGSITSKDLDGNARIHNTTVDMGCYEY